MAAVLSSMSTVRHVIRTFPLLLGLVACQAPVPDVPSNPEAFQPAVIFFSDDSAELDTQARDIVGRAAAEALSEPTARVRVLGFASSESGTAEYNKSLSQKRAGAVVDGLVGAGVDRSRVFLEPIGAVAFGLSPLEGRRVEILIGR